jgi:hypothetical protein
VAEALSPLSHDGGIRPEDISIESLKLLDGLHNLVINLSDLGLTTRDSLKLVIEDSLELLDHFAGLLEVLQNLDHVLGLVLEQLWIGELPSDDGVLLLNVSLGPDELVEPLLEHLDTGLNGLHGWVQIILILGEEIPQVDLVSNLLADFVRNGSEDLLEFFLLRVDVLRDRPDELESIQEGGHSLCDSLEVTIGDVLKLALKSGEELNEVFSLSLELDEALELDLVVLEHHTLLAILQMVEDPDDSLDVGHVELLEESVEGGRTE